MIAEMLEILGTIDMDVMEYFPISRVTSSILKLFIEWYTYHKDDYDENNTAKLTTWDDNFFKVNKANLKEIMLAAHFLDAMELFDLACLSIADSFEGKTDEEIKALWNIIIS